MRRLTAVFILVGIFIPIAATAWIIAPRVEVQAQDANLLRNPSFEGDPIIWENAGEVKIAPEWVPFHWDGLTGYPAIHDGNLGSVPTARPEYRPATLAIDPIRVHSGQQSQMWFSFYRNHYAGVQQGAIPVQVGQVYQVSVWAQAWASATDDPRKSEIEIYLTIGINPRGDCSRFAKDTVFSNWEYVGATYKQYTSQPVQMIKPWACVSIWSSTKYSGKHNDMYVDDAQMVLVPGGTTAPTPQPTYTPYPTYTPQPTPTAYAPCPTPGPGGTVLCSCSCRVQP